MSAPQGASPGQADDPTTAALISRLGEDVSRLVHDEIALARIEVQGKAKQAGLGAGLFGAAGVLMLLGLGALVAAGVLGLALVLDPWLSALLVGIALLVVAGVVALLGKGRVRAAAPAVPERTVARVKEDVDAVHHPGDHH